MNKFEDFDKHFNNMQKMFYVWMCFVGLLGVSILGFLGWVVVKLLSHFEVI